jgi:hypothetical protein
VNRTVPTAIVLDARIHAVDTAERLTAHSVTTTTSSASASTFSHLTTTSTVPPCSQTLPYRGRRKLNDVGIVVARGIDDAFDTGRCDARAWICGSV